MIRAASVLLTLLGIASIATFTACSGSSAETSSARVITVSVTADSASVPAGSTASVTATVGQDSANRGVSWKVSCSSAQCGTVSPGTTSSGSSTTYTAPTVPPANDIIVTVTATSVADTAKSNSATITVPALTVSASPATAAVQAGVSLPITAAVNNDISGQGVSWSISPASGLGTLSDANTSGVTYNGPTIPPASDATVTITATSLLDTTKSFAVTITVPSVTIVVAPATASVPAAASVPNITATVGNDPAHKGVNWTISCPTPPCGTISSTTSASGVAIVYTAPPTPPTGDLPVTLTATSVDDPVASSSLTITVLAITVNVTAPTTSVQFGDTVTNIVATVANDPAGKGVTWAVQPCGVAQCGTISSMATPSGGAITYTAPPSPVPSDMTVALVATAVSDVSKSGSIGITVLAITISVSPASGFIPVGATTALNATTFTATVGNDSSNQGVTWTLAQGTTPTPCSPTCGTINSNGIYAAPSAVPSDPGVAVTATSVTDTSKAATANIILTPGTVKIIPSSLNFGALKINPAPVSKTLTAQLTNTGAPTLNISSQATTAPYSVVTPCPASVASGASCTISVKFAPSISGTFFRNLAITDDDVSSPQNLPLEGRACAGIACFGRAIRQSIVTDRLVSIPAPTGPSKVGTRTLDLVDAEHSDPYVAGGQKRELLVRFWYPTAHAQDCHLAPYASPAVLDYLGRLVQVAPPQVKTNSCLDSPIAAGSHPVVVFTHGYTGNFTDYTFLFEDLASRGYVVASVAHTFESTAVQFPDGRLVTSRMGSHLAKNLQMDEPSTTLAVTVRLSDLRFVMNELHRLNGYVKSPFFGALDMSRVALAGHSLGGMTALLGVELEPRFRAAVSLDGVAPSTWFGPTRKPVMLLLAGSDLWNENNCHVWNQLRGPRFAVNLKESEHLTPSDAIWLTNGEIKTSGGMQKTIAAVRNYVAAFLDFNLSARRESPLLSGPSPDYPEVEVTTQTQDQCAATKP
jgi:dienelactone hydrolase